MLPIKYYVVVAILMLVFDAIWLNVNKSMYGKMVMRIQGKSMSVKMAPAMVAYVVMYVGMVGLVLRVAKQQRLGRSSTADHLR